MNAADPDDRTVASAEYVLGTLGDKERDEFLAQLARDPALQSEVAYWQDQFLVLAARVEPAEPPAALWDRIDRALQPQAISDPADAASRASATPSSPVTPAAPAAPVAGPVAAPGAAQPGFSRPSFWNRMGFWRGFSGLAFAASIVLATLLVGRQPVAPRTQYVAVLQSPDRQAGWLVQATDQGPVRLVALADPGTVPSGKSWQFWTKGRTATAPTSLGLLPPGGTVEIPRARLPELGEEQLFEITLEPEAGSPTGRPTGPVLFVGKTRRT